MHDIVDATGKSDGDFCQQRNLPFPIKFPVFYILFDREKSKILFKGGGEAPKNLSGRLVAATWWLFGFIVIASYTANLAAFLTVSRLETPVDSLEDLAKQYKIQFSPMKGSDSMIYFERMTNIEEKFYE